MDKSEKVALKFAASAHGERFACGLAALFYDGWRSVGGGMKNLKAQGLYIVSKDADVYSFSAAGQPELRGRRGRPISNAETEFGVLDSREHHIEIELLGMMAE